MLLCCIEIESMEETEDGWKERLKEYVVEHGDSLEFTKYFWKGCEPIERDIIQYWKFATTHKLLSQSIRSDAIAEVVKASVGTISTWRNLTQLPKLAHYLRARLAHQAEPKNGLRWLTMEYSHGSRIPSENSSKVPTRYSVLESSG